MRGNPKAAAQAVALAEGSGEGDCGGGVDVCGGAAGLSSSSALLVAFTLALLRANGIHTSLEE